MNKVKMPMPESRKPNRLTVVFAATIATILLLILLKYLLDRSQVADIPVKKSEPTKIKPQVVQPKGSKLNSPFKSLKDMGLTERQIAQVYLKLKYPNDGRQKHIAEQAKLLMNFKKKIHLEMGFPVTLDYIEFDLDDNVAAILGTGNNGKKHFGVLATNQKVSLETALNYLRDNTQAFDFVGKHKFLPEKMVTVKAPESTGLKDLQIVPSTTHKGQGLYVAFAPRKDGKGSYLFMMEAPSYEFVQNEEGLEKMLETVKTKP